MIELIVYSVKSIQTDDENITASDVSQDELRDFVDSMTGGQFKEVSEFVRDIPTLTKDIEFNCSECKTKNKQTLSGFTDFF